MRNVSRDFVQRILQELQDRSGALSADEAAQLANRSKSRVRHAFPLHAGRNFRTARKQAKLERGRQLLLDTRLSIPEISALLQYSDRTKFDKAFKEVYQLTPKAYRQLHANPCCSRQAWKPGPRE